jgi:malonyl-CoA/methylmalonyl-CoA synthetase
MLANLLDSLELPEGSRIAVQVEKSVEAADAVPGHAARRPCVRAAQHRLPERGEIAYFIANARARGGRVQPGTNFGWLSKIAFTAGTQHVFTLDDEPHRQPAAARRALQRPSTRPRRATGPTTWP